ncbi:SDR family NAD(P)-dependent oxidoreductase [Limnobacter sp.]|uniref:SDR family NAD(P)-dependent oxidoreductase n=1 Tax=Limnobacter sp. TaxID=2003368 RepID=UPI00258A2EA0|nr:SDR family NAD(P)-dependent oxidoreductase [Limnobacter sp.]HEX5485407.1 SDR family NAD(P)-dependent oxidoreductase [Limnobacter sp.]
MFGKKLSKNANAVVTGAGSGIGRAFALEIAKRGGRVVCADIDLQRAQETVEMITALLEGDKPHPDLVYKPHAWAVQCDVSQLAQVQALADTAEDCFEGSAERTAINLVINNAGIGIGGKPIGETPIEDWQRTLGVNMWGVIHGCHVFAPRLKAAATQGRKGKRTNNQFGIVNVASTASFAAAPLMGPYNASKAAALAVTETLAAEVAGTGMKVTALCPTFVKTNIVRDGEIDNDSRKLAEKLMHWTGMAPEKVVIQTLNALDSGELYVLPQMDARMIWRMKRLTPGTYAKGAGLLNRIAQKAL